jgi:signal transduction histidine kinase
MVRAALASAAQWARAPARTRQLERPLQPPAWRWLAALALLAALGAAGVEYLTARNPGSPPGQVWLALALVAVLGTSAVYARRHLGARMGAVFALVSVWSCLWLLTGSRDSLPFSAGILWAGFAPTAFCYLMLAFPSGRVENGADRRLLAGAGGALAVAWIAANLTSGMPPLPAPLIECGHRCPASAFYLGQRFAHLHRAAMVVSAAAWIVLVFGTALRLAARLRGAGEALRRSLLPLALVAVLNASFVTGFLIAHGSLADVLGGLDIGLAVLVPLAMFAGVAFAQLTMGHALAEFVDGLARSPSADPQELLAGALRDPSVEIAYPAGPRASYVDSSGAPVAVPDADRHRAVTWIRRDERAVAAVVYDGQLGRLGRYLNAAGQAAVMSIDNTRLERDLRASMTHLAASRARIIEAAHGERRRLERDLHDGVQQMLVGLRIRLDLAAEAIARDPRLGARELATIGDEMDQLLETVRSLARGIYPAILHDLGLGEALKSAARRSPTPTSVSIETPRRYPEDVDVAIYFCCIEALQNVTKHAGPRQSAAVRVWEDDHHLSFEVSDSGCGFDPDRVPLGSGLLNMRDRLEALGGRLTVTSRRGAGTTVYGTIPLG